MKSKNNDKKLSVMVIALCIAIITTVILMVIVLSMKKNLKPYLEKGESEAPTVVSVEEIQIYLPETYYVAAGLTMEIYNSQITNKCSYISDYNVRWVCDVGESLNRKYMVASTEEMIGDYELKVEVYDTAMNLLAEKESTLKIVDPVLENSFSLLEIGDSLSCDGMLYRRLQGLADNQIVFNGTRHIDGFLMEGRIGFSAEDYLNETSYHIDEGEDCHPFYNPDTERFDWNYYRETTGFYPEVIQVFLGTNNILGESNVDDIVAIIDAIRADDVMTPIYVVNTIFQGSQNGLGSWKTKHGEYLSKGWNKHEQDLAVFNLMTELSERLADYDDLYLVPAGISMDSEYNYESAEATANPYGESTEIYEVDPVHPNKAGYYQIADVMFSTFCGTM